MRTTTLAELSAQVGGSLEGDGSLEIRGAAIMRDAAPGDITLTDGNDRNHRLTACAASAVIATPEVETGDLPTVRVRDVHRAFVTIVSYFQPPRQRKYVGISRWASVSNSAKIGRDVDIHPHAVIASEVQIGDRVTIHGGVNIMAGCRIGDDVTIFPGAVLYEDTVLGARCIIHACAVIGAYGFGYHQEGGRHVLSAQLGNVVLGSDVEVGAGTTIDRGTYGPTTIGEGTKIDDQVMIAHNCRIGRHNMLCSQVGIAGSTSTGDYVVMAGQVGVRDHVRIGHGAVLGAMAGVTNDVPDGARMIGIPATPERDQKIKQAVITKLPEMRRQVKAMEKMIAEMQAEMEQLRAMLTDGHDSVAGAIEESGAALPGKSAAA